MSDNFTTAKYMVNARRAAVLKARWYARRALTRMDNPAVADARRLVRRLRRDPPDVLYLGDSQSILVVPDDGDSRNVTQIISDELGPDIRVHTIAGAGYHNKLHEAYLRFVEATDVRPLVLIDVGIRAKYRSWLEHPLYGHHEARAWLEKLDPSAPWWRIRAGFPRPGPEAWEDFYRKPHPSILGEDMTVGDYVRPLKSGTLNREETLRLTYAYYHGGPLSRDLPGVRHSAEVGRKMRELGCRAVMYHGPMPIERCVEILGPEIVPVVEENFRALADAYREGYGPDATIVDTGMSFATDEFLDDGSEHLSGKGRQRFGRILAEAIRAELERGAGTRAVSNGAPAASPSATSEPGSSPRDLATSRNP